LDDVPFETKAKHPLKQVYLIAGIPIVVIAKTHALRLGISDENVTWMEQISIEGGILLKVRRNPKETSEDEIDAFLKENFEKEFLPSKNCLGESDAEVV
jgi:hypothetical protein